MSTTFVTREPMILVQAVHLLTRVGCTLTKCEDRYAVMADPDGNHFHLFDDYTRVSTDLFVDPVQPYPFEDDNRHVLGECFGLNDPTVMMTTLNMVSEFEAEFDQILNAHLGSVDGRPEEYLWVRNTNGTLTAIDEDRLCALQKGAAAETEIEQLLINNPDWLRVYVEYVLGNYCVMISEGTSLPKWNPEWLEAWSKPYKNDSYAKSKVDDLPKLASGEIDYPALKSEIATKFGVKPGRYFIWQGPGGAISIETSAEFVQRTAEMMVAQVEEQNQ